MTRDIEELLNLTENITCQAGSVIMGFHTSSFEVAEKSPDNPVTDADLAADSYLHGALRALLPEAGWLSEETVDDAERLAREFVWVVDPLDGTKEFVLGIPEFTVSVALVQNGKPLVAVIVNPVTNEIYSAARGLGLRYNGDSCSVSTNPTLEGMSVLASRSERNRGEFAPFEDLVKLSTVGSIAFKLAMIAAGHADATWSRGPKNEWDICAGVLLIDEAGGSCTDLDGAEITFNKSFPKVNGIVADNGILHDELMLLLAPHRHTARTD